jgi:hypothetical protein
MEFRSTMQRARKRRWIWCLGGRNLLVPRCFRKRLSYRDGNLKFKVCWQNLPLCIFSKCADRMIFYLVQMWVSYLRRESGFSPARKVASAFPPTEFEDVKSQAVRVIRFIEDVERPSGSTRVMTMKVGGSFSNFAYYIFYAAPSHASGMESMKCIYPALIVDLPVFRKH